MPVYEYTALDKKGKTTSGIINAESQLMARQQMRLNNIFPISFKEISDTPPENKSKFSIPISFTHIRSSEISLMTRQLATLVGAGFPLVSAINALISQTKTNALKKILAKIKDSIVQGNSFANSLSLYPTVFSAIYINMVHAGETSGTLEIVLDRLADISEKQQALSSKIRAALAYPILMAFFGALVLFILLTFIVPSITSIFSDMNQALPRPTVFLIALSGLFKSYWWVLFIIIIALVIIFLRLKKTKIGRYYHDKIVLSLPLTGALSQKINVARFSRTLGSLLENGVSTLHALEIVKNIINNVLISDAVDKAVKDVGKGQEIGDALATSNVFPALSIQMIQVGEQSGQLETMLNKIADVYENEVESSIMSITSLIEPLMILIMGTIVGFIVLSICLPIFEMNQLIK